MIKKLLQKYQAYRDKKFLARLERVLNNNVDILENAYKILCWVIENGYILKEGEQ